MAFSDFTDLDKTAEQLGLRMKNGDLLAAASTENAPEWLASLLRFHLTRTKRPFSEMYAREYLISPLFSYLQMKYERLNMFSNDFPLAGAAADPQQPALTGTPDYLVSYPEDEGVYTAAAQFPLLAVAEAKNETFNAGWAQCAAELYVCQRLNERAGTNGGVPLWGIVTNGLLWEFGRLEGRMLVRHHLALDADPLEKLLGALDYIFGDCVKNGEKMAGAAASRAEN